MNLKNTKAVNQKGNILIVMLIGFVVILLLPPIILNIFPAASILFQIIMVFVIYAMVRGYLGDGVLTLAISGILIYFLVFKYRDITASLWVFQMLLGFGFITSLIWGSATLGRFVPIPKFGKK